MVRRAAKLSLIFLVLGAIAGCGDDADTYNTFLNPPCHTHVCHQFDVKEVECAMVEQWLDEGWVRCPGRTEDEDEDGTE